MDPNKNIKQGIWIYFLLLIFEGALRKWVLPGLSNPLLIIRDPVALYLIYSAIKRKLLPLNIYICGMMLLTVISIFTACLLSHGNLIVALYGARIFMVHFPVIFIIGRVFNRSDVIGIGKVMLSLCIFMSVLTVFQFYSPQAAWVNRGIGGDLEGAGFSGALGFMRPPGTFSFTNGNSLFFGLAAGFIFYFWLYPKTINRVLLISSTAALLAAIPLSISRTLFYYVVIALLFLFIATAMKPKHIYKVLSGLVISVLIIIVFSNTQLFQTAFETFRVRFTGATEYEGGVSGTLGNRYLGGMFGIFTDTKHIPFWGYGLGMGTNVGGLLLFGKAGFSIAEEEWPRIVGELGPMLGLLVIFLRLGLCLQLFQKSYRKLRAGDLLPWMLLPFALLTIPQAQWAQPTALGFSILAGGLVMASLRDSNPLVKKGNRHTVKDRLIFSES